MFGRNASRRAPAALAVFALGLCVGSGVVGLSCAAGGDGDRGFTDPGEAGTSPEAGGAPDAAGKETGADAPIDGPTNKRLLDVCAADAECQTGTCRPYSKGLASRCTKKCVANSECPNGMRCTPVGGDAYCIANDVGRACSSATQCNHACLVGQQYCTAPCVKGADCPNGYGCQPVGAPATNVCVKAEAACGPGDTIKCIAPAACDSSPWMIVSSCTLACSVPADCPVRAIGLPAWTCDHTGICRRPPDVYGPLATGERASYYCNAVGTVVNVCNDAQHMDLTAFAVPAPPSVDCTAGMTTDGVIGDVCVDSCRFRGGCTQGYACTAVGSIAGGRIGLCLPAFGSGEVGASCNSDAECFFGYCNRNVNKCSRDCSGDGLCPTGSTCTAGGGPDVEAKPFSRCQ